MSSFNSTELLLLRRSYLLLVGIAGLLSYVKFALPRVADAPDLSIEITPERLDISPNPFQVD